jgi:hypothetical protein
MAQCAGISGAPFDCKPGGAIQTTDLFLGGQNGNTVYFTGAQVKALAGTSTGGTVTSVTCGAGLLGGTFTVSGSCSLAPSGVTAGAYTNANITINAQGQVTLAANGTSGAFVPPTPVAVSAAGTTQGTATLLQTLYNVVTPVTAGQGVILKGTTYPVQSIANGGANPLLVYPMVSAQFGTSGANLPYTLGVGGTLTTWCTSATQCYVVQ